MRWLLKRVLVVLVLPLELSVVVLLAVDLAGSMLVHLLLGRCTRYLGRYFLFVHHCLHRRLSLVFELRVSVRLVYELPVFVLLVLVSVLRLTVRHQRLGLGLGWGLGYLLVGLSMLSRIPPLCGWLPL